MPEATSPRPRRWFQIHLITCIILMLFAGGLFWLNTRTRQKTIVTELFQYNQFHSYESKFELYWGWPLPMNEDRISTKAYTLEIGEDGEIKQTIERQGLSAFTDSEVKQIQSLAERHVPFSGEWNMPMLAANIAVALAILLITACAVETALRKLRRSPSS